MQGMLDSLFLTFFMTSLHWLANLVSRPPAISTIRSFPAAHFSFSLEPAGDGSQSTS
jgi:hypothetical protein